VSWLIFLRKLALIALLALLVFIPSAFSIGNLSVTAATDKTQYSLGDRVNVSGKVQDNQSNPVTGAIVSIEIDDPRAPIYAQSVTSDSTGAYSLSFPLAQASAPGQYTVYVTASKAGFNNGQAQAKFTVAGPGSTTTSASASSQTTSASTQQQSKCFIATATYGSELSPEVILLRSFRDSEILQTYAGSNFMLIFNAFYYSFSPQAASYIASHSPLRTVMEGGLYPLVGILYAADRLFALLSFNMELAATITGIFAGIAIGFVYAGPVAIALAALTRSNRRVTRLRARRVILLAITLSIAGLVTAEILQSSELMMACSAAVVLSSLTLGTLSMLRFSTALTKHTHN
jgi:hypothetical protein